MSKIQKLIVFGQTHPAHSDASAEKKALEFLKDDSKKILCTSTRNIIDYIVSLQKGTFSGISYAILDIEIPEIESIFPGYRPWEKGTFNQ